MGFTGDLWLKLSDSLTLINKKLYNQISIPDSINPRIGVD